MEPRFGPQSQQDGVGDALFDPPIGMPRQIPGLDREGAALGLDDRRTVEQAGDPGAVEGRRHHEDPEVRPQRPGDVERQGESEIRIERALVELVENHGRDAREFRVVEHHAGEHALGHDLDAALRETRVSTGP